MLAREMKSQERLAAKPAEEEKEQVSQSLANQAKVVADLEHLVSTVSRKAEERAAAEAAANKREKDSRVAAAIQERPKLERLADLVAQAAREEPATSEKSSPNLAAEDEAVVQTSFSTSEPSRGFQEVSSLADTTADVTEDPCSAEVESPKASGFRLHEWTRVPVVEVHSDDVYGALPADIIQRESTPVASPVPVTPHFGDEDPDTEIIEWTRHEPCRRRRWKCWMSV